MIIAWQFGLSICIAQPQYLIGQPDAKTTFTYIVLFFETAVTFRSAQFKIQHENYRFAKDG